MRWEGVPPDGCSQLLPPAPPVPLDRATSGFGGAESLVERRVAGILGGFTLEFLGEGLAHPLEKPQLWLAVPPPLLQRCPRPRQEVACHLGVLSGLEDPRVA